MAELIQFNCPSCGVLLRLPLALSAQQGPCPSCAQEIVAPDVYRGTGAYLLPPKLPIPPQLQEIFQPFAETQPAAPVTPAPRITPVERPELPAFPMGTPRTRLSPTPNPVAPAPPRASRGLLFFSHLALAALSLTWGYALAVWHPLFKLSLIEKPAAEPIASSPHAEKLEPRLPLAKSIPAPRSGPITKPEPPRLQSIATPPTEQKPAASTPDSAAADAVLKAFLTAPDWAARSAYVLRPEKVRDAMEAYSHLVPDGATAYRFTELSYRQLDDRTGYTTLIYSVVTENSPEGIPVAIQETAKGWQVDWETFVEFRDAHFKKFVSGPVGESGNFHLIATTPPPSKLENEHFASLLVQAGPRDKPERAYVKKDSTLFTKISAQLIPSGSFTPVLTLIKRQNETQQTYFEVTDLIAYTWGPELD